MKACPICRSTYEEWIDFCFNDGMPLVEQDTPPSAAGEGATAPVPADAAAPPEAAAPGLAVVDPVTRPVPLDVAPARADGPAPVAVGGSAFAAAPTMVPVDPDSRPRPALAPGFEDDEFSAPEPGLLKRAPTPGDAPTAPEPGGVFDVHIGGASPFDVQPAAGDAPTAPVPAFLPPPRGVTLPLPGALAEAVPAPPLVAPPPPPAFTMPAPAAGLHPGLPAAAPAAEAPPLRAPAPPTDLWSAQTQPDPSELDGAAGADGGAAPEEPVGGMDDAALGEVAAVLGAGAEASEPTSAPRPVPAHRAPAVDAGRDGPSAPRPIPAAPASDPFAEPPPPAQPRFGMLWVGMAAGVAVTGVIALLIVGLGDRGGTSTPPPPAAVTPAGPATPPPTPAETLAEAPVEPPAGVAAEAAAGTPAAGTPAAGTPAAGTPAAGGNASPSGAGAASPGVASGAKAVTPGTPATGAATGGTTRPTTTAATTGSATGATTRPTTAAVAPATRGRLQIITEPDGASVYVDEAMWGTSPVQRELAYGEYTVRVQLSGYKSESRTVTLGEGTKTVPFKLRADVATGQVNIFGPTGHTVSVDGKGYGTSPVMVQLSEGLHQFALTAPDGTSCTIPRSVAFTATGKPLTVTLQCP